MNKQIQCAMQNHDFYFSDILVTLKQIYFLTIFFSLYCKVFEYRNSKTAPRF